MIGLINNKGVPMVCCGEKMTLLEPNTVDAVHEKHIPVVKKIEECACGCTCGNALTVEVGSTFYPSQYTLTAIYMGFGKQEWSNFKQSKTM